MSFQKQNTKREHGSEAIAILPKKEYTGYSIKGGSSFNVSSKIEETPKYDSKTKSDSKRIQGCNGAEDWDLEARTIERGHFMDDIQRPASFLISLADIVFCPRHVGYCGEHKNYLDSGSSLNIKSTTKEEFIALRIAALKVSLACLLEPVSSRPILNEGTKEWVYNIGKTLMPPEPDRKRRISELGSRSTQISIAHRIAYTIFKGKKHKMRKYRKARSRFIKSAAD